MPAAAGARPPDPADYFSADYCEARRRFRAAALAAGAMLHALPVEARGPSDEALTIDIAWLGNPRPSHVMLHTCGLHGVEAFAGSAVQLSLLEGGVPIPGDGALILVHALNPYGMAWLRRANENNVDLNRNFLDNDETRPPAGTLYRALDGLLNPGTPPGFDCFRLRAAWHVLRHGFRPLQQAVAQGQYEFPHGLFYGGLRLEPGPRAWLDWLQRRLAGTQYLFALDMHTGLGRWGSETLVAEADACASGLRTLRRALQRPHIGMPLAESAAYAIRGGMGAMLPRTLRGTRIDFLLQEIGTYPPLRVLHALREENRMQWHAGNRHHLHHPAKTRLREALCPAAPGWRRRAVALGTALARAAAAWSLHQEKEHELRTV